MKRILCLLPLLIAGATGRAFAAEPVADVFREGLFEEEANRNLPAAIQAYEEVVRRLDEQRRLAATAIFRLGECHRKLGQTNEAIAAFDRVVREFPDEETLAKLSRENLVGLRGSTAASTSTPLVHVVQPGDTLSRILSLYQPLFEARGRRPTIADLSRANPDLEPGRLQVGQRIVIPLAANSGETASIARAQQRELLEQELALVEKQLQAHQNRFKAGAASWEDGVALQRDLLKLRRELVRLNAPSADLLDLNLGQAPTKPDAATNATDTEWVQREIQLVEEQLKKLEARATDRQSPGNPDVLSLKRDLLRLQRQLPENAGVDRQKALFQEETAMVQEALKSQRLLVEAGRAEAATVLSLERDLLALERQMAAVQENPALVAAGDSSPAPATSEEAEEIRRIQTLVANSPDLVNAEGENGMTPLMEAARKGQLAVAQYLLDHGARADQASSWDDSRTALSLAVEAGHRTMAELLLERGVTVAPRLSYTPLHAAAEKGFVSLAELLISKGADVNYQRDTGNGNYVTPLWRAVLKNHEPMVRFLLEHGADPNLAGEGVAAYSAASTPLTVANSASMARILLDHGADPDADNSARLMRAISDQDLETLRLLLDAGAKVNVQAPMIVRLTDGGYGPSPAPEDVRTPLSLATSLGGIESAKLLREHGADPNLAEASKQGWLPLHHAVAVQNLEMVHWLLAEGANVNANDSEDGDALGLVLSRVGRGQAQDRAGGRLPRPPLPASEIQTLWDIALVLVNAGADPTTTWDGFPVIHYAAAAGRIDVLEALKERGASLDERGKNMITPLMIAVCKEQTETIDWLLKNGADVNAQDADGDTALHHAAWRISPSLAKRLLDAGASRTMRNVIRQTPVAFMNQVLSPLGLGMWGLQRNAEGVPQLGGMGQPASLHQLRNGRPVTLQDSADLREVRQLLTPDSPTPPEPDKEQSP